MAKTQEKKRTKRPTALKRHLQSKKKRDVNHAFTSQVRSAMRTVKNQHDSDDDTTKKHALNAAYSLLDKSAKRGIFKQRKVNRLKSRLATLTH